MVLHMAFFRKLRAACFCILFILTCATSLQAKSRFDKYSMDDYMQYFSSLVNANNEKIDYEEVIEAMVYFRHKVALSYPCTMSFDEMVDGFIDNLEMNGLEFTEEQIQELVDVFKEKEKKYVKEHRKKRKYLRH